MKHPVQLLLTRVMALSHSECPSRKRILLFDKHMLPFFHRKLCRIWSCKVPSNLQTAGIFVGKEHKHKWLLICYGLLFLLFSNPQQRKHGHGGPTTYIYILYIHFLTSTPPLKRMRHALCSMTMMYEFKSGGVHEPMQNLSEHNSHNALRPKSQLHLLRLSNSKVKKHNWHNLFRTDRAECNMFLFRYLGTDSEFWDQGHVSMTKILGPAQDDKLKLCSHKKSIVFRLDPCRDQYDHSWCTRFWKSLFLQWFVYSWWGEIITSLHEMLSLYHLHNTHIFHIKHYETYLSFLTQDDLAWLYSVYLFWVAHSTHFAESSLPSQS